MLSVKQIVQFEIHNLDRIHAIQEDHSTKDHNHQRGKVMIESCNVLLVCACTMYLNNINKTCLTAISASEAPELYRIMIFFGDNNIAPKCLRTSVSHQLPSSFISGVIFSLVSDSIAPIYQSMRLLFR